jgi:hypothetical protein
MVRAPPPAPGGAKKMNLRKILVDKALVTKGLGRENGTIGR